MSAPEFQPLSYDLIVNSPSSNVVIGRLVAGDIKVLPLFRCDDALYEAVREEIMAIVTANEGQVLGSGHPTFDYVRKWDRSWIPKPGTIRQFSLFNSRDDLTFFDEDHHWFAGRHLNRQLRHVPEFVARYFGETELQNFRIQAIAGGGDLGEHRERIVAIPNREHHYKLRFHLPIVTNPGVSFTMDGMSYRMDERCTYLFNQLCMHGVVNQSDELRVHLVWDCYLNDHIADTLISPAWNRMRGAPAAG